MSDTGLQPESQIIEAHTLVETIRIAYHFPGHEPRENDPHYHLFNAARNRLERLGALKCWINNAHCEGQIELHHQLEFAMANVVDVGIFAQCCPDLHVASDEDFLNYIEGEMNLTPLCVHHHRGIGGIHYLPYPVWLPQRYLKVGVAAPAEKVSKE